jgi:SAM-dependent methyltransferase
MTLRFHEIAEANHRILNPFSEEKLMLLGRLCQLQAGQQQLDLCSGKGEMLCRWAAEWGINGLGVDKSKVFLAAAHQRAKELGVEQQVQFVEGDAATYPFPANSFDIVSCIGATWIGKGFSGTLRLLRPGLRNQHSLLLVGEPYWIDPPPEAAYQAIAGGDRALFSDLPGIEERIAAEELELIEMVLADGDSWDRYVAAQWRTMADWLQANAHNPEAEELGRIHEQSRREYLLYFRRYLGWGIFVARPRNGPMKSTP